MRTSRRSSASPARLALTGTPGTGKSAVGDVLRRTAGVVEVGELAVREGVGRRTRGGIDVDLPALSRRISAGSRGIPEPIVVGHLAHLLPIRDVVVLRCRPDELRRRLRAARRGTAADRQENYLAEALDLVLFEARRLRRRVWEVDTTHRSVRAVAAEVAEIFDRRVPRRDRKIDWLTDPRVAAHLLDRPA
ncbi:MAG: AAA family ATPase [Thermoplasmata archaeon]|nr:AAA family ATPase [Thermoplasmata archaeon]